MKCRDTHKPGSYVYVFLQAQAQGKEIWSRQFQPCNKHKHKEIIIINAHVVLLSSCIYDCGYLMPELPTWKKKYKHKECFFHCGCGYIVSHNGCNKMVMSYKIISWKEIETVLL